MPFVKTLEDQDLLRVIGFHQETGDPITLKVLFLQGISSVATIQRRLRRLKRLGVVRESRAKHDKRLVKLTLGAAIVRDYGRMFGHMKARMLPRRKPARTTRLRKRRPRA
jgi:hypothetical protein